MFSACESSSVRRRLSWIQNELLYPPIVHIRDEYNVFGGTSESMRPVELLRSTAGFAQHSQNFPIQRQLVETARLLIDREEILSRAIRRNTQRPGSRRVWRIGIRIAQCRMTLLVIGYIQPNELFEVAIRTENLNTSVASIGHVHVSLLVDLHVVRVPELTGLRAV